MVGRYAGSEERAQGPHSWLSLHRPYGRRRALRRGLLFTLFALASWNSRMPESGGEQKPKDPFEGSIEAIRIGGVFFRRACGSCHGREGRGGVMGPDLVSGRWKHRGSDTDLFRVISEGIAGTAMPALRASEERIWMIIAYLRSIRAYSDVPVQGDPPTGKGLFVKHRCSGCHMVNGKGGRLGPDLSAVGLSRSVDALARSIRNPGNDIADGFRTVILTTKLGTQVTGVKKNEDTFSIQLLDTKETLRSFMKTELRELEHNPKSLMPAYGDEVLSDGELRDILAYLQGLRSRERL